MSENEFISQLITIEPGLKKFAYRLTLKKEETKDLVQDTLLKGLLNRDKYVQNENFRAWLYTIMKNTFINNYRRRIYQDTERDETVDSFYINQAEAYCPDDPDSVYSTIEMAQIIEKLKDVLRIPLKMHIDGYKYKEISEALNINIGTVKSRIFLSRKCLKNLLKS